MNIFGPSKTNLVICECVHMLSAKCTSSTKALAHTYTHMHARAHMHVGAPCCAIATQEVVLSKIHKVVGWINLNVILENSHN